MYFCSIENDMYCNMSGAFAEKRETLKIVTQHGFVLSPSNVNSVGIKLNKQAKAECLAKQYVL